ncbi:FAD linked oxidase N-terminal [Penicillium concentricum]|uniref:FAD linked oxidase N-terminal n=1 Tax=Penicillium concentricum TaxID=293559 RepID=A0A9W9SBM2_9EURO|nr:FAD linked oxidase N-terminal [Penicillium concentricum]KAJ5375152.1 FAD linked oxidase N-terminal [Penicillium concentricum]
MRLHRSPSLLLLCILTVLQASTGLSSNCRCMPGDSCWPSSTDWARFNTSIGGRLVSTQPMGQPCHDPFYTASECRSLRQQWTKPELHDASSSSIMAAAVANETCDAFSPRSKPCKLGEMVRYAVNASSTDDFIQTIRFSQERNIRLVIRNTGHDYLGKSTGAGALSIWTHYLKNIDFLNYTSSHYTGPAVRMTAGVQGADIYEAAHRRGLVIVGGECATVGPVGGYTQGGGHSALSSRFGLGADQVLEWEVVDGMGQLLTASPTQNPDLYWALSGGGGGTYGVVYAMTVKAFPDFPVTGVVLQFENSNPSSPHFFEAVGHYHRHLATYTTAGGMAIAQITHSSFLLTPLTLPAHTAVEAKKLLAPFLQDLHKLNISYALNITQSPSYFQHYIKLIEPNPTQLVQNGQYGGRLLPLNLIQHNNSQLTDAVQRITADGVTFVGIGLNVSSSVTGNIWNSVLPAWRTAAMSVILSTYAIFPRVAFIYFVSVCSLTQILQKLAHRCQPHRDENPSKPNDDQMGPDSDSLESRFGVLYERGKDKTQADPQEPDWKQTFYGRNYDLLYAIKRKYDPFRTFYAPTAVGSEDWQVKAGGRLCQVTKTD